MNKEGNEIGAQNYNRGEELVDSWQKGAPIKETELFLLNPNSKETLFNYLTNQFKDATDEEKSNIVTALCSISLNDNTTMNKVINFFDTISEEYPQFVCQIIEKLRNMGTLSLKLISGSPEPSQNDLNLIASLRNIYKILLKYINSGNDEFTEKALEDINCYRVIQEGDQLIPTLYDLVENRNESISLHALFELSKINPHDLYLKQALKKQTETINFSECPKDDLIRLVNLISFIGDESYLTFLENLKTNFPDDLECHYFVNHAIKSVKEKGFDKS